MSNYDTIKHLITQSKIQVEKYRKTDNYYQLSKELEHLYSLQKDFTAMILKAKGLK